METIRLTPNQVTAYNLRRARELSDWTQEEAAERLEPYLGARWSKATFSVAERSASHEDRIREFTADDIVAFAAVFDLPIEFFFMPPRDVDAIVVPGATETLSPERLMELATTRQDGRLLELVEDRIADTYRLAHQPVPEAMEDRKARRPTRREQERERARMLRAQQKEAKS
jgi:hypothetical protein